MSWWLSSSFHRREIVVVLASRRNLNRGNSSAPSIRVGERTFSREWSSDAPSDSARLHSLNLSEWIREQRQPCRFSRRITKLTRSAHDRQPIRSGLNEKIAMVINGSVLTICPLRKAERFIGIVGQALGEVDWATSARATPRQTESVSSKDAVSPIQESSDQW